MIFDIQISPAMERPEPSSSEWQHQLDHRIATTIRVEGLFKDDAQGLADFKECEHSEIIDLLPALGERKACERVLGFKFQRDTPAGPAPSAKKARGGLNTGGSGDPCWRECRLRTRSWLNKPFIGAEVTVMILSIGSLFGGKLLDSQLRMLVVDFLLLSGLHDDEGGTELGLCDHEIGAWVEMLDDMLPDVLLGPGVSWKASIKSRRHEYTRRNPRANVKVTTGSEWDFFQDKWDYIDRLSWEGIGHHRAGNSKIFTTVIDRARSIKMGLTDLFTQDEIEHFGGTYW